MVTPEEAAKAFCHPQHPPEEKAGKPAFSSGGLIIIAG